MRYQNVKYFLRQIIQIGVSLKSFFKFVAIYIRFCCHMMILLGTYAINLANKNRGQTFRKPFQIFTLAN